MEGVKKMKSVPSIVTLDKGIETRCLILIKDDNIAETREGRQAQVVHAAYIDGYITATGELSRFITKLYETDRNTASIVYNAFQSLRDNQNASYNTMCRRLNDKESWDEPVIYAIFTSVWDGGIAITTGCKVNTETKEVFDIQPNDSSQTEALNTLEREYITMDGTDFGVFSKDESDEGDFWYRSSDDES
jgi:hypothetical protein